MSLIKVDNIAKLDGGEFLNDQTVTATGGTTSISLGDTASADKVHCPGSSISKRKSFLLRKINRLIL